MNSAGNNSFLYGITHRRLYKAQDFRLGVPGEDGLQPMHLLVADEPVLDALQTILGAQPSARILVMGIEASLPKPEEEIRAGRDAVTAARESLYEGVSRNARLDSNFFLLVFLSTVVAAVGLIEGNVAVLIGAMVIAPLLGPNLALSLGTALGDMDLVKKATMTLLAGIVLAVSLSAALGLMLGQGQFQLAAGAGLLLGVNIASVNLASKIIFFAKGIKPRTWNEKETAKRAMTVYVAGWAITLAILLRIIYLRGRIAG